MKPALPDNEMSRLAAVAAFRALDADATHVYNDFAKIASYIAKTPIVLITLIDSDEQIFKSKIGVDIDSTPREISFCAHAILRPNEALLIEDATKDPRFSDNPLVTSETGVRFYYGVPLVTQDNFALGTLCVVDRKPSKLSADQKAALNALARRIMNRFEIHKTFDDLEKIVDSIPAKPTIIEIENLTKKLGNLLLKKKDAEEAEFK